MTHGRITLILMTGCGKLPTLRLVYTVQRVDLAVTQYLQATKMAKLNVGLRTVSVCSKKFSRMVKSPGSRIRTAWVHFFSWPLTGGMTLVLLCNSFSLSFPTFKMRLVINLLYRAVKELQALI